MGWGWGDSQIERTKELRAKMGCGLREAYDLTSKYPTLSPDEILAKLSPATLEPDAPFSSDLPVRGWFVVSEMFPELGGYHAQLSEEVRAQLKTDERVVMRELVFKNEADELINKTRQAGRGPIG